MENGPAMQIIRIRMEAYDHQPRASVFAAFDRVLLLYGGSVAYLGAPRDALLLHRVALDLRRGAGLSRRA